VLAVALAASMLMAAPVAALAQGYICAEGGGSLANDDWAKPAFEWMFRHGNTLAAKEGTPLRAVILGAIDDGETPPTEEELAGAEDEAVERFRAGGAASIRQLYINAGNAGDDKVAAAIREAHMVWIRGGAQSRYCRAWKGTPVEAAIRGVFARGGVVGGTSAGCAVLGEFIYDAAGGSCEASDALRDPFAKEISFTTGFLELVPRVIFDSHFTERARIARLPVFLGRIRADHGRDALGIGMDSRTALCIGPDGDAEVFGSGTACFLHLTPESRIALLPGDGTWPTPPTITNIAVRQIVAGEKLNIRQMTAALAAPATRSSAAAADSAAKPGQPRKEVDRTDARFIRGDATRHAQRGMKFIDPEQPKSALFDGGLIVADGTGDVPGAVVATRSLTLKDRTQNAAGGVLWVLANSDARWGSFMDMGAALRSTDDGKLQSYFPHGKLGAAMSAPVFIKTEQFKPGAKPPTARQACSFDGLRMHVLAAGWSFDPATGAAIAPAVQATGPAPEGPAAK
jgi:cyanophycinase